MASRVRLGGSPGPWLDGRMELRHLRTIAAVARHGSFSKAAEELHLAQSAVSQQLRRFEQELGVEVFRRSSRSVEITPEGEVILGYAQRVLREVDGLHGELQELIGLVRGEVRIGGMYPTGPYDLADLFAQFRERHPGVAVNMVEDTQDDLLARLRADELDCAFTAVEPETLGDEYAATLIWEEEFVVALPPGHTLAAQERITFDELAGEDLIAYRENSALRRRLERRMAQRGLALALRPMGPEDFTWPVALVWRAARRQPAAAKAFLAVALELAENQARRPRLERVA